MAAEFRDFFSMPDDLVYFNASYLTPLPQLSAAAGTMAIAQREESFWEFATSEFFDSTEKLRSLVAILWGTLPHNIAVVPSVSYGVETAVRAIPLGPGDEVVIPQDDFPSNVYPWAEATKNTGARIVMVPRPHDFNWTRQICESIRRTTRVVSVPLTDWSDGTLFDLKVISQRAREVGAALVVDVSQSFGAQPFSISDFDPDFLFSVGYKWQLGPYGLSYLYVADRWREAQPIENAWLNRKGSEDFTRLSEYREEYQEGARRFDAGQRSQFHLTPMALESMRLLREVTIAKIQTHNQKLVSTLHQGMTGLGFQMAPLERLAGHMLGVRHRNWPDMNPLVRRLKDRRVFASARGPCLRISPHLYNHEGEVEIFLAAVGEELRGSLGSSARQNHEPDAPATNKPLQI